MVTAMNPTMLAVRLTEWGQPPELCHVPIPEPSGSQVLLRVEAAGLCHSDLHLLDATEGSPQRQPPFTLGHEVVGTVVDMGAEADACLGDLVVVHGPCGCGRCQRCLAGEDNYCDHRRDLAWAGIGIGLDGGMAEYMLVPHARHLVRIEGLEPASAAPLADAGLTAYHAIQLAQGRISTGGVVVVIGAGGLGHLAIQILTATTSARVVAIDVRSEARGLALACGAVAAVESAEMLAAEMADLQSDKADAVLDFVGSDTTLEWAVNAVRSGGEIVVVGSAGGSVTIRKGGQLPLGTRISIPFWGSHSDLQQVIALAESGAVVAEVEVRPLASALAAIEDLRSQRVKGRLVLVP